MMRKISCFLLMLILLLLAAPFRSVQAQEWTVEECLAYGIAHHAELRASDARLQASSLGEKAAKAAFWPEITGTASIDHYWKIPVQVLPGELIGQPAGTFIPVRFGTPWMGNFGAEATFNIANPAVWQQAKLATLRNQLAQERHSSTERLLQRNIRMAHQAAVIGKRRLELTESRVVRLTEIHALLRQQFDEGLLDKIGLNQSQVLLNDAEAQGNDAKADYLTALVDLKFWMGYPLDSALHVPDEEARPAHAVLAGPLSPTELPEYGAYRTTADLAAQEWRSSRAALLPRLAIRAGYNRLGFGSSIREMADGGWFPSGYVGVQLQVPILSIGNMAYEPKRLRALAHAAELDLEHYQAQETSRVIQQRTAMKKASDAIVIRKENVALAQENEHLVFQKLEKGIVDMVALKEAQQALALATVALLAAQLDYAKHQAELHYLLHIQ